MRTKTAAKPVRPPQAIIAKSLQRQNDAYAKVNQGDEADFRTLRQNLFLIFDLARAKKKPITVTYMGKKIGKIVPIPPEEEISAEEESATVPARTTRRRVAATRR